MIANSQHEEYKPEVEGRKTSTGIKMIIEISQFNTTIFFSLIKYAVYNK